MGREEEGRGIKTCHPAVSSRVRKSMRKSVRERRQEERKEGE